jgi:hypothetical protein
VKNVHAGFCVAQEVKEEGRHEAVRAGLLILARIIAREELERQMTEGECSGPACVVSSCTGIVSHSDRRGHPGRRSIDSRQLASCIQKE